MKKTVLAALLLSLALTGCSSGLTIFSNYRRLENIELVRTITADAAAEGVNVSIYGTTGEESVPRMYERTGSSIGVALGELMLMPLGRDAILSHTENILIGEDLAADGLDECLDYIERYSEMRMDTGILIVRDGTARDLVAGLSGEDTPASDIIAGLDKNISRVGQGYIFTCREIAASLAGNGCALVQCVRGVEQEKLFEARGDLDIQPAGFAVVRENMAPVFLTEEETLGAAVLLGKFQSKNVDLPVEGAVLTASVDSARAGFTPVFGEDGRLTRLRVALELDANVISVDGLADLTDTGLRDRAQEKLSGLFTAAALAAIRRGQELNIDFLDLEHITERREPLAFQDMPVTWRDLFPDLPVEVRTESTLIRTYDIVDPPRVAGEEEKNPWEKLIESLKGS